MKLSFDPADMKPLAEALVQEVLDQVRQNGGILGEGRLGFSEAEAAALIGMEKHNLRDARLRGEVRGRRIGKKIYYSKAELERFLLASE